MRILTCTLAFLVASSQTAAQTAPPPPPPVSVKFRLMAWNRNIPGLAYGERQTTEPVEQGARSAVMDYSGPPLLTFTLAGAQSTHGVPPPTIAATTLPAGVSKITLLAFGTQKGRFDLHPLPEDGDGPGPSSARLHNFSGEKLRVIYNKREHVELNPGASAPLRATKDTIVIRVGGLVNSTWRELFNNVIEVDQNRGTNVLLIRGPRGGGIGMFPVPAWPADPKQAAAPATPKI